MTDAIIATWISAASVWRAAIDQPEDQDDEQAEA